MSLEIDCDKEYRLLNTGKYRLEGEDLYPNDDCVLKTTSAMMTLEKDTIIIVKVLNINAFHPDMFKGYVPSLDAFVVAISFFSVTPASV